MSRIRLLVAPATLVALLLAGCTGDWPGTDDDAAGPSGPAAADENGEVDWAACPELLDELFGDIAPPGLIDQLTEATSYDCGTVTVPQDWEQPDAPETHEIALVRARSADQSDRIGSLLVNPGGPGGSGIESAVFLSFGPVFGGLADSVTARFDLVGFDPRGVARSSPVDCFSDEELDESFGADPDPVTQGEFDEGVAEGQQQAEACAAEYGDALRTYSTKQTAHDMEAIRVALGDGELNYLGFSYGTLLGATYAHMYPDRIRSMVLDGAIDPREDLLTSVEGQAQGFERALDNFSQWCADSPDECSLRPDARTAVSDAIEAARDEPVTGPDGREATAGWVFWAVIATLYSQDLWPQLAAALEQLDAGDPAVVFELADAYTRRDAEGNYDNMFDANTVINCADSDTEVTVEQVRDLQEEWRDEYPVFGAPLAVGVAGCALWPVPSDPYPTGPAEGAPPILVIGTLGDPATPYEATAGLAELLGVGVVLTYEGEGHTAYPEVSCIADAVDAYLIDLTVPEEGTRCPAE
ncbi:alpha/beta fold hydrolase [Natronosporangium hydrolyticum]|uniref:Alpha/beta fold hydrolase n=1 Tax=Natronosporangium hydrolyticum TaxID=2811111 RepID=A0A895YF20_9ACTN|nr:alpha/beta hydrolase [Natronosporangium hydrolyticum]QSB16181.1 alpha/beta fold hydrolase [Natronosporangium hydrolyticum]